MGRSKELIEFKHVIGCHLCKLPAAHGRAASVGVMRRRPSIFNHKVSFDSSDTQRKCERDKRHAHSLSLHKHNTNYATKNIYIQAIVWPVYK